MRMLLNVTLPGPQEGNCRRSWKRSLTSSSTQRSGTKPEACYFTEQEGRRGALLVVGPSRSLADPVSRRAMVPELHNADVEFRVVMTPEELGRAGLEGLGKKWGS